MRKSLRWLVLTLSLILCCGTVFWFSTATGLIETDYSCFGTFLPSLSQVAQRTSVQFPPSTANLEWRCLSTDLDRVYLRFTIDAKDKGQFIASTVGFHEWTYFEPGHGLDAYFFNFFADHPNNEQDLKVYTTWQGTIRCGWTNNLLDMDDPSTYTVYVDYSDLADWACSPK